MATAIPKLSLKRLSVPSRVTATIFFRLNQICTERDLQQPASASILEARIIRPPPFASRHQRPSTIEP
jgi:hypothetical protein